VSSKKRNEDYEADEGGGDGSEEHGAGGEVFGAAKTGAVFLGYFVSNGFKGGVEGFGNPDEGDGDNEPKPVLSGDAQVCAEKDDHDGGGGVNSGVVLGEEKETQAAESVAEALQPLD